MEKQEEFVGFVSVTPENSGDAYVLIIRYGAPLIRRSHCPTGKNLYQMPSKLYHDYKGLFGELLRPRFSCAERVPFLGMDYIIEEITYHELDGRWVFGYRMQDATGKTIHVLENQLKNEEGEI